MVIAHASLSGIWVRLAITSPLAFCVAMPTRPPGIEQQAHTRACAFAGPLSYRVLPRVKLDHHDGAIEEAHRRQLALHDDPIMRGRHVEAEDVSCVARIVVTLLVFLGASAPTTDLGIQL